MRKIALLLLLLLPAITYGLKHTEYALDHDINGGGIVLTLNTDNTYSLTCSFMHHGYKELTGFVLPVSEGAYKIANGTLMLFDTYHSGTYKTGYSDSLVVLDHFLLFSNDSFRLSYTSDQDGGDKYDYSKRSSHQIDSIVHLFQHKKKIDFTCGVYQSKTMEFGTYKLAFNKDSSYVYTWGNRTVSKGRYNINKNIIYLHDELTQGVYFCGPGTVTMQTLSLPLFWYDDDLFRIQDK